jgi:hypothetical protein
LPLRGARWISDCVSVVQNITTVKPVRGHGSVIRIGPCREMRRKDDEGCFIVRGWRYFGPEPM